MKRGKGFTLIELLVVIAIIAILAAILFPIFSNAKERGRQIKCLNNLKQLSQAFRSYVDDFDGIMPSAIDWGVNRNWVGCTACKVWVEPANGQLWRYTHNDEIYQCPTDKNVPAKNIYPTGIPAGKSIRDYKLSYSLNQELASYYASTPKILKKLDTETAGRVSKVLLIIHENRWVETPAPRGINDGYFGWRTTFSDVPSGIHYDGTTCAYVDGHVKWISKKETERQADVEHAATGNPNSDWLCNTTISSSAIKAIRTVP